MKKAILCASLLFFVSYSFADTYIDNSQKTQDNARRELVRKAIAICAKQKFKTVGEKEECRKKYIAEARDKYPNRGTDEYSKKYYSSLNRAEAEQKLIELESIWRKAELIGNKPGEITRSQVELEGWWIQTHILKGTPVQTTPFFIECKKQKWQATVDHCPLGKGGNP